MSRLHCKFSGGDLYFSTLFFEQNALIIISSSACFQLEQDLLWCQHPVTAFGPWPEALTGLAVTVRLEKDKESCQDPNKKDKKIKEKTNW